ncbi:MAG: RdgB/HAM1 family non-canonical purine NTP pyrophosphatase [Firmicutes bacterium]|nr:RdgB/HAM1 family non-canonical purine NTP pyrophosphatase [Bacillota bacterium]
MKVILASRNEGKLREMRIILSKYGMDVVSRDDAGIPAFEVEETGTTFEENSYLKAKAIMEASGCPTIADDSGLVVDALGGEPGVYSARYAGEGCTDDDNNELLLRRMESVPDGERSARFVSVITMLFPDGRKLVAKGTVEGRIDRCLDGEGGFGYDPLFIPDGYDRSFGVLSSEIKNSISHRAKALSELEMLLNEEKR